MSCMLRAAARRHYSVAALRPAMRLPPLPTIGQVIQLYKLSAKQKLSQNFLLDLNITERMVRTAGAVSDATLIEVGSGPGSLTRSCLLAGAKQVIAVEKDSRFIPALKQLQEASNGRLIPALGDALLVDEQKLLKHAGAEAVPWTESESRVKLVGNLPFAISTPLLLKWMRLVNLRKGPFAYGRAPMILTFQAEVADRLVAAPGSKEFGRLSVMVQQLCDVRTAFTILGKSFVPAPDVDARVVFIQPRIDPVAPMESYRTLEYVLREVMGLRRKQLTNAIERLGEGAGELLKVAEIHPSARPEDVTIQEWVRLANAYHKWPKKTIPAEFNAEEEAPRNYTALALKLAHVAPPSPQERRAEKANEEEEDDEDAADTPEVAPTIHFPSRMSGAKGAAETKQVKPATVLVRRIFSPDVVRIPPPPPQFAMPEARPVSRAAEDAKKNTEERLGLKRKELRKVVQPLQPGNPSKMLPTPHKFRAHLESEREQSEEEAERAARNVGRTFAKFSDRFEEEHHEKSRKSKERKNAIVKAKRTRSHRGFMRTSKGDM